MDRILWSLSPFWNRGQKWVNAIPLRFPWKSPLYNSFNFHRHPVFVLTSDIFTLHILFTKLTGSIVNKIIFLKYKTGFSFSLL